MKSERPLDKIMEEIFKAKIRCRELKQFYEAE